MSVDLAALLHELDVRVTEGSTGAAWLLRTSDGDTFEVEPTVPAHRVTAAQVRTNTPRHRGQRSRPLHVGETATSGVIERAVASEIDILTSEPLRLILEGRIFEVRPQPQLRHRSQHPGRRPWTRWALERYLVLSPTPSRQSQIAETLGVTQQSVSRAAQSLSRIVLDEGDGLFAADRSQLLTQWQGEYPGPGGQEFGWYSLDPVTKLVDRVVSLAALLEVRTLVSGDVAADRIAPWKLPERGRIYVSGPLDLADDGFVSVPLDEANVVTCIPRDPTLWRLAYPAQVSADSSVQPIADAAIVYWDLLRSGEQGSDEAAAHLAQLLTEER